MDDVTSLLLTAFSLRQENLITAEEEQQIKLLVMQRDERCFASLKVYNETHDKMDFRNSLLICTKVPIQEEKTQEVRSGLLITW